MCVQIHADAAEQQPAGRLLGRITAQHGLDAGDQLHHAEGLCQIVVRAQIQSVYLVVFCALCRSHDHGDAIQMLVCLHAAQQLNAVHAGQHHVQHDQLRLLKLQGIPEFSAVCKAAGLKARRLQRVDLNIADACVVLHAPDHA